ncbi:hypothetical protein CJ030_MR6G006731 [Morella rubra]|uniref:F-box associated beta-propeller type 3 domain-containing protein n=1 Tax=Morella rubra TaxID=262757 RepID=A0A6A1VBY3_9ROSI|nr:hypothetical protein CJ030_MR6G006731 [Morella rubra]
MKKVKIPLKSQKLTSVLHCNGLLFSSYNESDKFMAYDKLCVYNLFTAEVTPLPSQSLIKGLKVAYGFGFHPSTKEYKVVRIVEQECVLCNLGRFELSLDQSVKVFTLGTYAWRIKRNSPYLLRMQPSEALVNGALHWLGQPKLRHTQIIVSFDLAEEIFCQVPSPNCRLDMLDSRLLVLGGCLSLAINTDKRRIDIWLMKNYSIQESWTKEFTINFETSPLESIRPLCLLKNGKVLIEYRKQSLFSYDPQTKTTEKIQIGGFLPSFQAVPHVEIVNSAMPPSFCLHSFL